MAAASTMSLEQSVEKPIGQVIPVLIPQVPPLVKICPYATTLSSSYQFCGEKICPYAGMRFSEKAVSFGRGCGCSLEAYQQFTGIRKP
jgi:hypothetical protein